MDKPVKTICWECALSGYGNVSDCPWEREFKPVDGWTAERNDILINNGDLKYWSESYCVLRCPLYKHETRRNKIKERHPEQAKTHKSWQRIDKESVDIMAKALRSCRIYHGLTQTWLARMTGTSQKTISKYENGLCAYDVEKVYAALPDILDFMED